MSNELREHAEIIVERGGFCGSWKTISCDKCFVPDGIYCQPGTTFEYAQKWLNDNPETPFISDTQAHPEDAQPNKINKGDMKYKKMQELIEKLRQERKNYELELTKARDNYKSLNNDYASLNIGFKKLKVEKNDLFNENVQQRKIIEVRDDTIMRHEKKNEKLKIQVEYLEDLLFRREKMRG